MNEFFKKLLARATSLWANWSKTQRLIFGVVVLVVIVGIAALFRVSASPIMVSVINAPIRDEAALDRIVMRLNQEDVDVSVTPTGLVQVKDNATARRMRAILIREDLIPNGVDPWQVFDRERWTLTDFERSVNLRRAQERMIIEHLRAIDDIDNVMLQVAWPPDRLFRREQQPVTASVTIIPKPGSDITIIPQNRKKIEGIQKLLQYAIVGLQPENISISDNNGILLNDFEGMAAADRLALIGQEQRQIRQLETHYRDIILSSLQSTFSADRVRDLNIKVEMDMSQKSINTLEHFPFTMRSRTPGLPYDDSVLLESVTLSRSTSETRFEGTGFNPEGPGGVEPHVPPAYKDMNNLFGRMEQVTNTQNEAINQSTTQEERSPSLDKVTVSVNIDGIWDKKYDAKRNPIVLPNGMIEREYTPVSPEIIRSAVEYIQGAIGYNSARGDSVVVTNIPFDRTLEFRAEDAEYFKRKQMQTTILVFVVGLTLLLFGFMLFRMISREMERRKRLAEEERARREQMMRESAMAAAEEEGMDVSISMEERSRMELMESAINLAKEHPEDAAQLIRTWLLEE
ncbi:MAG: flagellar M-ring protein FliF [Treponema sp.]|nr:flagellar M-ring protein FliF [Treponema sp.]MCL2237007.1 flagellar M-ring protein FliF [Treponema sp.]